MLVADLVVVVLPFEDGRSVDLVLRQAMPLACSGRRASAAMIGQLVQSSFLGGSFSLPG